MISALGMTRFSKEDKRSPSLSIDIQTDAIRTYCKFNGLDLVRIFEERNVSGYVPLADRPQGKLLLQELQASPMPIVCFRFDRLFRKLSDATRWFDAWNDAGIRLHSATENLDIRTHQGWCFACMTVMFAEMERRAASDRASTFQKFRAKEGKTANGTAPYGKRVGEGGLFVEEPAEMAIRRQLLRKFSFGWGPERIANDLADKGLTYRGGRPWTKGNVRLVLRQAGRTSRSHAGDDVEQLGDDQGGAADVAGEAAAIADASAGSAADGSDNGGSDKRKRNEEEAGGDVCRSG